MQIAFLGMGAMGSRMAARLVGAGHAVTVWNRTPGRSVPAGAAEAGTVAAAAAGAEVVLAMLWDEAAARAVWAEALAAMAPGALGVDCSTLPPGAARDLHAHAVARGLRFAEAPVAGSRPQAEAGQLVFLAGGAAEDVAAVAPVLRVMGRAVHHVGGPGAGAAVKLVVNALLGAGVAVLAEGMGLLDREGVDAAAALAAVGDTSVGSPALAGAGASMLAGQFAPMAPVDLIVKDLRIAAATGPMPMAEAAGDVYARAVGAGHGGDHLTAVVRLYR
jgi:3-hydroxyisobutyrate dehydrogenase